MESTSLLHSVSQSSEMINGRNASVPKKVATQAYRDSVYYHVTKRNIKFPEKGIEGSILAHGFDADHKPYEESIVDMEDLVAQMNTVEDFMLKHPGFKSGLTAEDKLAELSQHRDIYEKQFRDIKDPEYRKKSRIGKLKERSYHYFNKEKKDVASYVNRARNSCAEDEEPAVIRVLLSPAQKGLLESVGGAKATSAVRTDVTILPENLSIKKDKAFPKKGATPYQKTLEHLGFSVDLESAGDILGAVQSDTEDF